MKHIYSTGIIDDSHLRLSKYFYNTSHWSGWQAQTNDPKFKGTNPAAADTGRKLQKEKKVMRRRGGWRRGEERREEKSLYGGSYIVDMHFSDLNFPILKNVLLGVGMPSRCMGTFPEKVGGIQMLARLAPSSQTVEPLLRTHRLLLEE